MNLPPGLQAARQHRPLLADYILGLCAMAWGLHVLWFPEIALADTAAWSWITVPVWTVASTSVAIGTLQIVAAVAACGPARRAAAVLACGLCVDFTVKVFGASEYATVSSEFCALAIGNAFLVAWPRL